MNKTFLYILKDDFEKGCHQPPTNDDNAQTAGRKTRRKNNKKAKKTRRYQ